MLHENICPAYFWVTLLYIQQECMCKSLINIHYKCAIHLRLMRDQNDIATLVLGSQEQDMKGITFLLPSSQSPSLRFD